MRKQSFFLKFYAITVTFILGYLMLSGFKNTSQNFEEITVERINIIEPDGKLIMTLSNSVRQHPGMMDGKQLDVRRRPPGMIFFNEEQDEVGGLIYSGNAEEGAGMVLSFDQFKNDQVMQMQYIRNPQGRQQYGMNIWDRSENIPLPRLLSVLDSLETAGISDLHKKSEILKEMNGGKPVSAQRMFSGKNFQDETGIFIKDEFGRTRINLFVDKDNLPHFQILDENGEVVREFP